MAFYRRNLPHWHPEGKSIFVTWRLYGSLPASLMKKKRTGRNACATPTNNCAANASEAEDFPGKKFLELDAALDSARRGPRWLADPELAAYAEYPIVHGAELGRFMLHAYVSCPTMSISCSTRICLSPKSQDHSRESLPATLNARLGRTGKPLWQDESFDHWIRNSAEFERIRHYIEWNPVTAGFAARPEDWKWSSAGSPYFGRLAARTAAAPTIH